MIPAGFFPHLIIPVAIVLALVVLTIIVFKVGERDPDYDNRVRNSDGTIDWDADIPDKPWYTSNAGQWIGGITLFASILTTLSFLPFNSDYFQFYRVTGTVTHVTNTITDSNGELSSSPVVTLDTLDNDVVMKNPRAVNLTDKEVTLTCTIEWVPYAQDRINCDIYEVH